MNYYQNLLKTMLVSAAKGFPIGLVIACIYMFGVFGLDNLADCWQDIIYFTLYFGGAASLLFCMKSNEEEFVPGIVKKVFKGIGSTFGGLIRGGLIGWIIAVVFLVVVVMCLVLGAFVLAALYLVKLVYIVIMCILEKQNKLEDKKELCERLDKMVTVVTLVVMVVFLVCVVR